MRKGHSGKILANEADNTIVKSYDMTKYKHLSHFHSLIHKACQNVFISPTQKICISHRKQDLKNSYPGQKLSLTGVAWSRFDKTINLIRIQAHGRTIHNAN